MLERNRLICFGTTLRLIDGKSSSRSSDWQNDPANNDILENLEKLQCEIDDDITYWKGKIDELNKVPLAERQDGPQAHRKERARLEDELESVEAQEKELLLAGRSEVHSVVERLIRLRDPRMPPYAQLVDEPIGSGGQEVGAPPNSGASPSARRPAKFGIDADEPGTHTVDTEAEPSPAELRKATEPKIHETISAIYDYAVAQRMKPPNIHDIAKHVLRRLELEGLTATLVRIQDHAGAQRHADRRRKQGHRFYDTLLPFLDDTLLPFLDQAI